MRAAAAVAIIFIARFAAAAWFDPSRDGDIAWQRNLGLQILRTGHLPNALGVEAFTAPNAAWVPQEWLLSIAIALTVHTPYFFLLVLAATAAAALTLWFTARTAAAFGSATLPAAFAVFCAGEAMLESYGIRAQVFAWACLAALLYVIRTAPPRRQWLALPIVLVWANLHASAMLAPVLLLLWTVGCAVEDRKWSPRVARSALLAAGSALAVVCTPLGFELPLYALGLLHSPIRAAITEWQPTGFDAPSFTLGLLPAALVAVPALVFSRRRAGPEIAIASAVLYLAVTAVRNVPVAAIVLAPLAAKGLTAVLPEHLRINRLFHDAGLARVFAIGACTAAAIGVVALLVSPEFKKGELPATAVARLAAQPGVHRLYCEDFAWCSLALDYPNLREFLDGRADPYPLSVWQEYVTVFHARGQWRAILDRRGVDAVLVRKDRALGRAMPSLRGWHCVYADAAFALFLRTPVPSYNASAANPVQSSASTSNRKTPLRSHSGAIAYIAAIAGREASDASRK
ncbi:MAG TPA: hypothetical protein VFL13_10885 [Candidatus Baltobacteraceae bacterium]|nr:hypothetical protein [Candidatus Baltobacteraceae bacterium]